MDRVRIGIEGIDDMLGGGLITKRPYVVIGSMGSGKTTLGVQFLLEGLRNEESVLLVALDDPPNEIKENMHSFGWDISGIRILDATPDVKAYSKTHAVKELAAKMDVSMFKEVTDIRKSSQQRTMEISIYSVQQMLKQEMHDYKEVTGNTYTRLVIDSMTALRIFGMKGLDMRTTVQSFLRFLSELEVTALIMIDAAARGETLDTEVLLARGEIVLHKWRDNDHVVRAVSIEKMRGSDHDAHMRPMKITGSGITVDPKSELFSAEDEFTEEFTKADGQVVAKPAVKRKSVKKARAKKGSESVRKRSQDAVLKEKTYKTSRTL